MSVRSALILDPSSPADPDLALTASCDAILLDSSGVSARRLHPVERPLPAIWLRLPPLNGADIEAELARLRPLRPTAFVPTGAETAADIDHLGALLAVQEASIGLPDGTFGILAIVETAGAVFEIHRMARASPRLIGIGWDGEALAKDLGADEGRDPGGRWTDPLQTVRTLVLAAAADARLAAIDSPARHVDLAEFRTEAERAARDGFSGKLVVSAEQAAIADAAFAAKS